MNFNLIRQSLEAMAVVSATSNGTVENVVEENDRKGWLLKRTHFTYRWKLAWFELKESMLVYGDNEKVRRRIRVLYISLIWTQASQVAYSSLMMEGCHATNILYYLWHNFKPVVSSFLKNCSFFLWVQSPVYTLLSCCHGSSRGMAVQRMLHKAVGLAYINSINT